MIVAILSGNSHIESRQCREVRLPDGRAGVVWRGLAYPLLPDGSSIDAAGEGLSPARCAVASGEILPSVQHAVIEGGGETYVLLSGSVTVREQAAAALAAGGLIVLRTGRYLGAAIDGASHDWFIRIATPEGGSGTVGALLGAALPEQSAQRRDGASLRVALLTADLSAARAREEHDRDEIARLRAELAARIDSEAEKEALRAAIEEQERLREALEHVDPPSAPTPRHAKRLGDEIKDVVSSLLSRIVFIRDSETMIAAEFANRRRLYAALQELQQSESDVHSAWKALKGGGKWIERHVSNGQDDQGRIYARRRADDQKWDVLVSHKGEQTRDIAWLRRNS